MSKKKPINKAAAIREYLTKHPDVGPTEVARELTKRLGVDVTRQYVTNIRGKMRWARISNRP